MVVQHSLAVVGLLRRPGGPVQDGLANPADTLQSPMGADDIGQMRNTTLNIPIAVPVPTVARSTRGLIRLPR